MYYTRFDTPLSEIILAGDEEGLKHLILKTGEERNGVEIKPDWRQNDAFFAETVEQLRDYITGRRKDFDITIDPAGTDFQKQVWEELRRIPYGETRTYGEIAAAIGKPAAARAVGAANGRNPIALIIPCHRVNGHDGKLTGYAYGIRLKQQLLELEKQNG